MLRKSRLHIIHEFTESGVFVMVKYEIHLKNGEILEHDESSGIPYHHSLSEKFINAAPNAVLFIGKKLIIPAINISYLRIIENEVDKATVNA